MMIRTSLARTKKTEMKNNPLLTSFEWLCKKRPCCFLVEFVWWSNIPFGTSCTSENSYGYVCTRVNGLLYCVNLR